MDHFIPFWQFSLPGESSNAPFDEPRRFHELTQYSMNTLKSFYLICRYQIRNLFCFTCFYAHPTKMIVVSLNITINTMWIQTARLVQYHKPSITILSKNCWPFHPILTIFTARWTIRCTSRWIFQCTFWWTSKISWIHSIQYEHSQKLLFTL